MDADVIERTDVISPHSYKTSLLKDVGYDHVENVTMENPKDKWYKEVMTWSTLLF